MQGACMGQSALVKLQTEKQVLPAGLPAIVLVELIVSGVPVGTAVDC